MKKQPELFIACMPTGYVYCDKSREEYGDYVKVAYLNFRTLKLTVYKPKSKLLPEIKADVAKYKKGQEIQVSTSGQTRVLGV